MSAVQYLAWSLSSEISENFVKYDYKGARLDQYTVNKHMRLSLSMVRIYTPIRWCTLNRAWKFRPFHYPHVRALEHKACLPEDINSGDPWPHLCYSSCKYDWKPSLADKWKIAILFGAGNSLRSWDQERPVAVEHHDVELSIATVVQRGWRINITHA